LSTAAELIRAEIAECGAISFARFMQLALYCPVCGFYEKENDTTGRRGDFYTSVSVGSLFGELLAFQFGAWLQELGASKRTDEHGSLRMVEAGAHDGRLAKDILGWLRLRRSELAARIEYWIIEPSARRQVKQQELLSEFRPQVRWFSSVGAAGLARVTGIIFSNELLDAMPVHRVGWDAERREWFEWGVGFDGAQFTWIRLPRITDALRLAIHMPPQLACALPDGFTTEVGLAAAQWWRDAARLLECGRLLAFDYGLAADELFAPQRSSGTLRAYRRHHLTTQLLAHPGHQDLTAHVNFSAIQHAGEAAGLRTEAYVSQAQFLTGVAAGAWRSGSEFGPWTEARTRQFQTLTHPEHLGRAFRVLMQTR
jgi:SAM-dependent MidA family methyltransferase